MADLFDAQRDSAEFQAALERVKTSQRAQSPAPSSEPLFHTDHQGNLVDRAGAIVRPKLEPLVLGGKPKG
jgi:hypothetical protein